MHDRPRLPGRIRSSASRPFVAPSVLGLLTILVLLAYEPFETPVVGDRALFAYLGQAVARGRSVYEVSMFDYLPLGPMIGGAAIVVGQWFGLAGLLALRLLSMGIVAACVALTFTVTRRATRSPRAGAVAALVLMGISILSRLAVSGLEPKVLVLLFGLLGCAALQGRRWASLGLACGLGFTTWQPFVVVALVLGLQALWVGRRAWRTTALRLCLGALVGLLPAALYLTAVGGWADCWRISFVMLAEARLEEGGRDRLPWTTWIVRLDEAVFVWAAGLGLVFFVLESLVRRRAGGLRSWLRPRLAGVPLVSAAWALWSTYSFDYLPDLLPLLWLIGFWSAWLFQRVEVRARAVAKHGGRRWASAFAALVILTVAVYGLADALTYRTGATLSDQREMVSAALKDVPRDAPVVCISSEAFYVLDERLSPLPFVRLRIGGNELSDEVIELATGFEGCRDVKKRIRELAPQVFIASHFRRNTTCVGEIAGMLRRSGYREERLYIMEPVFTAYEERTGRRRTKIYTVLRAPG